MSSIWQRDTELPHFPRLNGDKKTDVLIIGGGIAGILTAYFLKQNSVDYILVERDTICSVTTKSTTAKITYQTGLIYDKIIKSSGIEKAQMYFNAYKKAFDCYRNMCKSIDCDYEIKDNYVYSLNNRKKIENEISALEKIGYSAQFAESLNIPINTEGAVCFKNQAQFNPLKFIKQIAKGLNIYEHTAVSEMIGNTAVTDCGRITAKNVIVATHFPFINKHGSYYLKLYQHRSYAIALDNAPDIDGMYVDENHKGLSFRNYKDYLILGGGGHRTGKSGGNWDELYNFSKINYPGSKAVCQWAAQDCMSLDSIPYIGNYSSKTQGLYVATGFNKWGITGAMVSAMILSDMVQEKENEYAKVFNPSRNIIKPQLAVNAFEAVTNLLTITNKRCPHLGCALKWNKSEHSWDCACHGSRFSESGKLLNNPANDDLEI